MVKVVARETNIHGQSKMGCGASKAALVSEDDINIVSRPANRSDKLAYDLS